MAVLYLFSLQLLIFCLMYCSTRNIPYWSEGWFFFVVLFLSFYPHSAEGKWQILAVPEWNGPIARTAANWNAGWFGKAAPETETKMSRADNAGTGAKGTTKIKAWPDLRTASYEWHQKHVLRISDVSRRSCQLSTLQQRCPHCCHPIRVPLIYFVLS